MKGSRLLLVFIFLVTAGLAAAAVWIGWRLSQEEEVTPEESEAFPSNVMAMCDANSTPPVWYCGEHSTQTWRFSGSRGTFTLQEGGSIPQGQYSISTISRFLSTNGSPASTNAHIVLTRGCGAASQTIAQSGDQSISMPGCPAAAPCTPGCSEPSPTGVYSWSWSFDFTDDCGQFQIDLTDDNRDSRCGACFTVTDCQQQPTTTPTTVETTVETTIETTIETTTETTAESTIPQQITTVETTTPTTTETTVPTTTPTTSPTTLPPTGVFDEWGQSAVFGVTLVLIGVFFYTTGTAEKFVDPLASKVSYWVRENKPTFSREKRKGKFEQRLVEKESKKKR